MRKRILTTVILLCIGLQFVFTQSPSKHTKDTFTYQTIGLTANDSGNSPLTGTNQAIPEQFNFASRASNSSTGFGKTIDELSVSLTGGVNYEIPIVVPPGINGVVPKVSLQYNSQSGNGIAGFGWNIKGVSVITRIASTKHHDNVIDPVDFDNLDRFSLDGKRLIATSGTYGGNGTQYKTEIFSNLKITSHGVSPYGANYGPAYFKVQYPDGSIAYYGNSSNSRSRTNYAITYWQNPQGIRISYEYINQFNGLSIRKIKYGSRTTTAHKSEIRFDYDSTTRQRSEQSYIDGVSFMRRNILKNIYVFGGTSQYRRYELGHNNTSLWYTRLTSVREYGTNNLNSKNPIYFNYSNTNSTINYVGKTANLSVLNVEQRNAETRSLDINGDGNLDFLVFPKGTKDKFWLFKDVKKGNGLVDAVNTGRFEEIFPITALNHQNKILGQQDLAIIQNAANNQVKFKVYSNSITVPIAYQYEKVWTPPTYQYDNSCSFTITNKVPQQYISGDFNGDGLTDIIAISKPYTIRDCNSRPCGGGDQDGPGVLLREAKKEKVASTTTSRSTCCKCSSFTHNGGNVNLINLDRRLTSGFSSLIGRLLQPIKTTDKIRTADVNGDGKTDILHFSTGRIHVYTVNQNNRFTKLWDVSDTFIKTDRPLLFGDYNGDGKADIMIPEKDGSANFGMYISTGKSFTKTVQGKLFVWRRTIWNGRNGILSGHNLIPLDINGDGRTDIIDYTTITYNNSSNGSQKIRVFDNVGVGSTTNTPGHTNFIYHGEFTQSGNLKHFPIPIFLSSDKPNKKLEFASISNKWVTSFTFTKDNREDVLLRSINNSGITYGITYKNLVPNQTTQDGFQVYEANHTQTYPYADLKNAPETRVVTGLTRTFSGSPTLKQSFAYHGAVYNIEGLGFLGFKGIAQSNWHTGSGDRIFSVSKYDPLLRGAKLEEYSQASFFNFNSTSNLIAKTTYTNSSSVTSNKIVKVWANTITSTNKLNGTTIITSYLHDTYNNPTRVTTNYIGAGKSVIDITYANNTGATYYIGRPIVEKETKTIHGNSFSTEKRYAYNGYLLSSRSTKGNGTAFDVENFTYDVYGNLTKRTTTPSNTAAREIKFQYDSTGRYATKSTDTEGLTTSYQYNLNTGTLKSETNHFGHKTSYSYNAWNQTTQVTDYLGKKMTTTFTKANNLYTTTITGDDGGGKITINDALGRIKTVKEKNALGQWVSKDYQYDALDRVLRESEPYLAGAPSQWNVTKYDLYGRPITQMHYTGKAINITYNGLTVSVNDGTKTVITTKDAMDNVVKTQDPGGTIQYTYFGNGALKSSNYNGIVVSNEQDGWGRKTKLVDPSAGTYTYAYNGFGQTTKESTPKGNTTYTYDTTGKITNKKISGDLTNINVNYTYDGTTKLIKTIYGQNNRTNESFAYDYKYDTYHRLKITTEYNSKAVFDYRVSRDGFGRIATEAYWTKNNTNNEISYVRTKNIYGQNSGELIKILNDEGDKKVLWELKQINQRGQATQVTLGNGITKNRTYNTDGFVTKILDKTTGNTPKNILNIDYTFDSKRGNLLSRKNHNFNWNESFAYDNLDRLTKITGATNMTHTYDVRGKITSSNDVGSYTYMSNNSYQLKSVNLNTKGDLHFQANPLQKITYNSFKKPITISQKGSGKVDFTYGILQNRSHAYYGGDQAKKENRRYEKHYSAVSPVEIEVDKQGQTKIVTYIGGDAYTAPIVHVKQTGTNTANGFFYLHRDYQGSIMAISDANGAIKEQRQFGAWGEVDRFKKENSEIQFDHSALLNRGYTGHEHFFEVGIIHMNGRMYDPKLKRFLAPDNFIQDPSNTQNYNRYAYVLNNPLKYTDPSGELIGELAAIVVSAIVKIAFAASAAYAIYGFANLWTEDSGGSGSAQVQATPNSGQSSSQEISSGIPILDARIGDITNLYGVLQTNSMFSTTSSQVAYATTGPNDWIANGNELLVTEPKNDSTGTAAKVLAGGWGIALGEPTPAGEAVMTLATGIAVLYYGSKLVDQIKEEVGGSSTSSKPFYYATYTKVNPKTGKVYVGRTSGYGTPRSIVRRRDNRHHMDVLGYGKAKLSDFTRGNALGGFGARIFDRGYWYIRGSEQLQIEMYRSQGISGNDRNGIGQYNRNRDKYLEEARWMKW